MTESLQPKRQPGKRVRRSQYVKRCPACREKVPADARKCRHCGELLDPRKRFSSTPPARKPMSTCVILLIVGAAAVPFVAIVAAIAIPNLLESKKTTSEVEAVISLRQICTAEEIFKVRYSRYGTLDELQQMGVIDISITQATTPDRARSGYYYSLSAAEDTWSCTAIPVSPGSTYYIDQTGSIRTSSKTLVIEQDERYSSPDDW